MKSCISILTILIGLALSATPLTGQLSIDSPQIEALKTQTNKLPTSTIYLQDFTDAYGFSSEKAPLRLVDKRVQMKHFGVFCRIESRIEKKSRLAPRFRLGSTDYVNYLEGKTVRQ